MRMLMMLAVVLAALLFAGFGGFYAFSEARLHDVTQGVSFAAPIPDDATSIERGRHIARTRGCFGCHGQQLEGKDFGEQWDWPERAVAPNLALWAREHDDPTLEGAIRRGISSKGKALVSMPSYNFTRLTDEDLAALIAFLRVAPVVESRLPKPKLGLQARWDLAFGGERHMAEWADAVPPLRVDPVAEPLRAQGEYLAMTMCNECHGLDLRGVPLLWDAVTPDLVIVGAISREEFEALITTGIGLNGRELGLMRLVAPDRFRI
ncbi:MAG: cytochrome c [Parvularculaceae bacterium]